MHEPCEHAHPGDAHPGHGSGAATIGIPQTGHFDGPAFEQAIADMLRACGVSPEDRKSVV